MSSKKVASKETKSTAKKTAAKPAEAKASAKKTAATAAAAKASSPKTAAKPTASKTTKSAAKPAAETKAASKSTKDSKSVKETKAVKSEPKSNKTETKVSAKPTTGKGETKSAKNDTKKPTVDKASSDTKKVTKDDPKKTSVKNTTKSPVKEDKEEKKPVKEPVKEPVKQEPVKAAPEPQPEPPVEKPSPEKRGKGADYDYAVLLQGVKRLSKTIMFTKVDEAEDRSNKKKMSSDVKVDVKPTSSIRHKASLAEETQEELTERILKELEEQNRIFEREAATQMCTRCNRNLVSPEFWVDKHLGFCEECAAILKLGQSKEARKVEYQLGSMDGDSLDEEDEDFIGPDADDLKEAEEDLAEMGE